MRRQLGPVTLDEVIAQLATAQSGVVEHGQLRGLGLTDEHIRRRVERGQLRPEHRGVYAVGHSALGARGRRIAAVLACGPDAMLSHHTAADQWGIRQTTSPKIHVSITTRAGRSRPGLVIHRPRRLPAHERTTNEGIAITTVARTLLDLADVVSLKALRKAIERSEQLRFFDRDDIERVIAHHPRRRIAKLRRALELAGHAETRSPLEHDFLALCIAYDLPRPEVNVEVAGLEVDFFFRDAGLVVETDGFGPHGTKRAFEDDRRRDVTLAKAGLTHVRLTHDRIANEAAGVASDVSSLLGV